MEEEKERQGGRQLSLLGAPSKRPAEAWGGRGGGGGGVKGFVRVQRRFDSRGEKCTLQQQEQQQQQRDTVVCSGGRPGSLALELE